MENFSPCSDRNAVKVVAFAFNMSERFSDAHIKEISKKAKEAQNLIKNFGDPKEQQLFSTTLNPDGTQQHFSGLGGVVFEKKSEDKQFSWKLIINVDQIIIQCLEYTRWQYVFKEAKTYIKDIFELIGSDVAISQISLEYLDEFILHNVNSRWKYELFSEDCKFLLPNIFDVNDYWHINHGYFITKEELEHKMLDTLNINFFADERDAMKQKIQIRTQHNLLVVKYQYNEDKFLNYLDDMHKHSKSIFESIIREEVRNEFAD